MKAPGSGVTLVKDQTWGPTPKHELETGWVLLDYGLCVSNINMQSNAVVSKVSP